MTLPPAWAKVSITVVEAGLIYRDKPVEGGVAAYEDGFTFSIRSAT